MSSSQYQGASRGGPPRMGPPKTRRRRSGRAVQYDGFFFKLVSKHPGPVHAHIYLFEYIRPRRNNTDTEHDPVFVVAFTRRIGIHRPMRQMNSG